MNTDFNCWLLDVDKFRSLESHDDYQDVFSRRVVQDIELLSGLGIKRLVSFVDYDEKYPVSATVDLIKKRKQIINQTIPIKARRGIKIDLYPRVRLSELSPYIRGIHRLAPQGTNYLFLACPSVGVDFLELDEALNKILYSCRLIPVFTEFDACVTLYDQAFIDKLLNIKGAVFQFSLSNELTAKTARLIKKIINNDNVVIFGTCCQHYDLNSNTINGNISKLKNELGESDYLKMMLQLYRFLR